MKNYLFQPPCKVEYKLFKSKNEEFKIKKIDNDIKLTEQEVFDRFCEAVILLPSEAHDSIQRVLS